MCLLKPSELNNNNCAHDECKNFRMLNKPACIYSFNPAGKPANLLNLTPSQSNSNLGLQNPHSQDLLGPRPSTYLTNNSNEDPEDDGSFVLNKKKLRVESNNGYGSEAKPAGLQTDINGQPIMMNTQFTQMTANNGYDDKSLFNAPILNSLLLSNNNSGANKVNDQRNNTVPVIQVAQPLYMPYMGNQMGIVDPNMQNISYIPVQQGFQQGFQPQLQNFAQNMKMKPAMDMNLQNLSTPSSADNFQKNFNIEEHFNQFQNKLSEVLISQNKMLIDLREKNDLVQDTLACLINEVSALKQIVKQNNTENVGFIKSKAAQLTQQYTDTSREIASSESLLSSLYGPNHNFQYQLVFKSELPLPLYRERNFKFTVLLTDKDGNLVKNCNRIPLSLAIYTSENPPKFVDVNTSGNKILKGIIDKDMVDGAVTFDKIQIKEVTSHFRNGWVFFVVYPKTAGTVFNRATPVGNAVLVDHNQVRPLVLERVVVKAKKLKEKDAKGEDIEEGSEIDQEL